MKKSELNTSMLFKLREQGLCVLLDRYNDDCEVFYNNNKIINGKLGGLSTLDDYYDNLKLADDEDWGKEYDIIAIKQFDSCTEALHKVINQIEPEEWDWVEEVGSTVQNITINLTIDSKCDISEFVSQLEQNLKKMKYPQF